MEMPSKKEMDYRFALAYVRGILIGLEKENPSPRMYRECLKSALNRIDEVNPLAA